MIVWSLRKVIALLSSTKCTIMSSSQMESSESQFHSWKTQIWWKVTLALSNCTYHSNISNGFSQSSDAETFSCLIKSHNKISVCASHESRYSVAMEKCDTTDSWTEGMAGGRLASRDKSEHSFTRACHRHTDWLRALKMQSRAPFSCCHTLECKWR